MPDDPVADFQGAMRAGLQRRVDEMPIVQAGRYVGDRFNDLERWLGNKVGAASLGDFIDQHTPTVPAPTYGPTDPQGPFLQRLVDAANRYHLSGTSSDTPRAVPQTAAPSLRSLQRASTPPRR